MLCICENAFSESNIDTHSHREVQAKDFGFYKVLRVESSARTYLNCRIRYTRRQNVRKKHSGTKNKGNRVDFCNTAAISSV